MNSEKWKMKNVWIIVLWTIVIYNSLPAVADNSFIIHLSPNGGY